MNSLIKISSALALLLTPFTAQNTFSAHDSPSHGDVFHEEPILDAKGQTVFRARFYNNEPKAFSNADKPAVVNGLPIGHIFSKLLVKRQHPSLLWKDIRVTHHPRVLTQSLHISVL